MHQQKTTEKLPCFDNKPETLQIHVVESKGQPELFQLENQTGLAYIMPQP